MLPDLFAGKMHARLFRKWGKRVKGRDWYDLEWYVRKGVLLHLDHLAERANDSGDWADKNMTKKEFIKLLNEKIDNVDIKRVREDVIHFIPDEQRLDV